MQTVTANQALADLPALTDQAAKTHQPIAITGPGNSAVLVAQEDWEAIQETLNLLAVRGMRECIRKGLETPLKVCAAGLDW